MLHTQTLEKIRERVVGRNNNLTGDSFQISSKMLEQYLAQWEPPTEDEEYALANVR